MVLALLLIGCSDNGIIDDSNIINQPEQPNNGENDVIPNNQIWYTSTDGNIVIPYKAALYPFGENSNISIKSNVYIDGKGIITLSGELETIGNNLFCECSNLKSITIPNSVTNVARNTFEYCENLENFTGKFASNDGRCLIVNGRLVAFAPAGLTSYEITNDVEYIEACAFTHCSNLTSITIPDSVTAIGDSVFACCSSLTDITIGKNVETIGYSAFFECNNITKVYCKPTTPPVAESFMLNHSLDLCIYVPMESVGAYTSAKIWSSYESNIIGYDFKKGEVVVIRPNNYEIFYTNGSTKAKTSPHSNSAFDATILSHTYDANKRCWIITFDKDISQIGYQAFYDCGINSITIPDSVTTIGDEAFSRCTVLSEFNGKFASEDGRCLVIDGMLHSFAPGGITSYVIPDSITTIGNSAFYWCDLTSITIPDSVITIGDKAFSECAHLTDITIGNSVTTIGKSAFYWCECLTNITIPDSVTIIGEEAFCLCSNLTSVTIGDSVTAVGARAFSSCSNLTEFKGKPASEDGRCLIIDGTLAAFAPSSLTSYKIPDDVKHIGTSVFSACNDLTNITIPNSVTTIEEMAFYYCFGITNITIPNSVTRIGAYAFDTCISLTSITIGDSVTTIGEGAFNGCRSLTSITIPQNVTTIRKFAFYSCGCLTNVYCKAPTPPAMDSFAFKYNASDRVIYVPANSIDAYRAANGWSDYADAIVAYDFENGVVVE